MSKDGISIVTVCFRDRDNLAATLDSVMAVKALRQDVEVVVVDGGSADGTIELVEQRQEMIDVFVSEPDEGTFDAMNKGIRMSTRQWVVFINSGDRIADPERFARLNLTEYASIGLLYGNTVYNGRGERKPFPEKSLKYGLIMACHQSILYNKDVLKDEIYYSTRFRLVNEYDQVCRIVRGGFGTAYVDMPFAFFLGGGLSSQISWEARRARYFYVAKHYGLTGLFLTATESLGWKSLPPRRS